MALKLDCAVCAASLDADDLAIRHGLAICNYCSNILRITPKVTEVYQKEIEQRLLPANIAVKHDPDGKTTVTIKGVPNTMMTKSSCLQGIGIGLGITAVVSLIAALFGYYLANNASVDLVKGLSPFCFHMFIILLVTSVVVATLALGFRPPSLVIQNDVIIPVTGSPHLPKKEIKQIYTSVITATITPENGESPTSTMVYALTEKGKRVLLIGPFDTPETGSQIEELIEVELGIFDLPVYGDPDLPRETNLAQIKPVAAQKSTELLHCEYCGIVLQETAGDRKRGYILCEYCSGLTLLYEPGSEKPILGIHELDKVSRQYRVEEKPNGFVVYSQASDSGRVVVAVSRGKLHSARVGGAMRTLAVADITNILVQELTRNEQDTPDMNVKNMVDLFNNLRTAPAYSGEVDLEKIMEHSLGLTKYQIIARMREGQDYWLIKSIDDPREAFLLAEKIKEACQL